MKINLSIILSFLAVLCLSTGGIFVKISSLPPINTAFYRILFAIIILFPFVYKDLKHISKKTYLIVLFSGVFLAIDLILWNESFSYTSVANANLFVNLVPFTTIPLSYFIFKERINQNFLFGLSVAIIGIIILMSRKFQESGSIKGDTLAFFASVFYGLFLISVYEVRSKIKASTLMFISGLGSLPVLALGVVFFEEFVIPSSLNEIYILLSLAIFSQIFGQGLLSYSLGKVSITISSIIILTQPVFSAIYAFIIFHETLTLTEIIGLIIILLGVYIGKRET